MLICKVYRHTSLRVAILVDISDSADCCTVLVLCYDTATIRKLLCIGYCSELHMLIRCLLFTTVSKHRDESCTEYFTGTHVQPDNILLQIFIFKYRFE